MGCVKDCFRLGALSLPARLMEPLYLCQFQCSQAQLGNMYGVLSKRRGKILDEDLIEGTDLFTQSALVPVTTSFGLALELLDRTSGGCLSPQLQFSHWQVIDEDPFWRVSTLKEVEDFGAEAHLREGHGKGSVAKQLIDEVRKRKGLPVDSKVVADAEKQRTLTKMK